MNKYDDDDFNASEYERKLQRRYNRLMVSLVVGSIIAFVGMVIFWK